MIRDIIKKRLFTDQELTPVQKEELLLWFELHEFGTETNTFEDHSEGGDWTVDDLTSQIDGITSHFTLTKTAKQKATVSCNLEQQPSSVVMDTNMRGFYLVFVPTTKDKLIAGYPS